MTKSYDSAGPARQGTFVLTDNIGGRGVGVKVAEAITVGLAVIAGVRLAVDLG